MVSYPIYQEIFNTFHCPPAPINLEPHQDFIISDYGTAPLIDAAFRKGIMPHHGVDFLVLRAPMPDSQHQELGFCYKAGIICIVKHEAHFITLDAHAPNMLQVDNDFLQAAEGKVYVLQRVGHVLRPAQIAREGLVILRHVFCFLRNSLAG